MIYIRHRSLLSYAVLPALISFLLIGVFGIVWLRSNFISTEYSISELEIKKMEGLREAKMLLAERSSLLAIKTVEKTAMSSVGLVFPDRKKVFYVDVRKTGPQKASLGAKEVEVR